ncbi:COX15/CtaA family protein [Thauera linaloolentis]|uniref:Cytochrome aa3 oxidase assembly protein n=1 Tax=Thauera linaloolentis (strain DSM 12138 / JCM 21573 / CCUG 41526 / CIP 105981 / IAM 15112 / NBRC 102519 / 47Lol) TaxID=1123367 RepID=N6YWC0_THAL4|nr:COX15/CtaA family protein [Thauera linaloolentis]ENO86398.1 cytochrome aa3 oxidase assembly protein [Thauera linaloolentis 47Lol = DSM 12138]MCM8564211.1 COX15/CtaA family protein [Thauera linaloolentis]
MKATLALYRRLALGALLLTFVVVVFGAYVRLADAGLGCPDWPGCYGKPTPAQAADAIRDAHAAAPHGPVSLPKAWKEMIHRYLAAALGLLIVGIAVLAWRLRDSPRAAPGVAGALVAVVMLQGLLGKWTVTLLLKPAIVTAHLLGGLTTLALLAWLTLCALGARQSGVDMGHDGPSHRRMVFGARLAFVLLAGQIALGGWTSTNYAALACLDFPACHGSFAPDADYANAFHVVRELGMTADGELLSNAALTAIHWAHRVGALVAGGALFLLGWALCRRRATFDTGAALLVALTLQIGLGIANVLLSLPLPLAAAHNAGAALLVGVMVWVNVRLGAPNALPASAGRRPGRALAIAIEEGRS